MSPSNSPIPFPTRLSNSPFPFQPPEGSERVVVSGAKAIGAANPDESLQVTVLLRSRVQAQDAKTRTTEAAAKEKAAVESLLKQRAAERQHLTREQFLAQRGALEEDVEKVEEFARVWFERLRG